MGKILICECWQQRVEAKQVMFLSQIQPVDHLVCNLGHNARNIQMGREGQGEDDPWNKLER